MQKRATFNQSGRRALNLSKFFSYFTLVSINKSREEVRLLDSFYLAKGLKRPDIFLKILDGESRKMTYYWVRYRFECNAVIMRFVMLNLGFPIRFLSGILRSISSTFILGKGEEVCDENGLLGRLRNAGPFGRIRGEKGILDEMALR